jgi:hypothetical protein
MSDTTQSGRSKVDAVGIRVDERRRVAADDGGQFAALFQSCQATIARPTTRTVVNPTRRTWHARSILRLLRR